MPNPLSSKFTLADLRSARVEARKIAMLTCYDYTTARLMHEAAVPMLLVGDSAANVVLGYPSTIPVSLSFMIEITAAVRRGAPAAFLVGDMPFGSYQASVAQGVRNVARMMKLSGCDCIKLEVSIGHAKLVNRLADAGVAVMAHLGLRPQAVNLLGGYRSQGRTALDAQAIIGTAIEMEHAGAAAILLEAVPASVSEAVVARVNVPVIGCGAGPACHGHVVVSHDILGLTGSRPRFAPQITDAASVIRSACDQFVKRVSDGQYPAPEHGYDMPVAEQTKLAQSLERSDAF